MDVETLCRCCLAQGTHKDLNATHVWLNQKEVYAEMLNECFNIILSASDNSRICEMCVKLLRDSLNFKQQVLRSEQEFLTRLKDSQNETKLMDVKLEPKLEEDSDESDDYFLADTARENSEESKHLQEDIKATVKKKAEPKKKIKPSVKKNAGTSPTWRSQKIKTLVNRLTTISSQPEASPAWVSRALRDKTKHRDNLRTVLSCSNATPFSNKSLLGFICGYCPSAFPDPADLRTHTRTHHSAERLDYKSTFDITEYNVKLDVADLTCTICNKAIDDLINLKDHLVKSHGKVFHADIKDHMLQFKLKKGDVYDCAMCTSTYETFKMLKQHMNKHYSNYNCGKCEASFATKRSLNAHITTHQEGSFKCDHCDKIFSSKPKKHYHEKTKHLGARNISNCPFCNEPFRSYYQRNQHLVKVHNSEAQYKCNVCSKAYILKSLLMYHIKKNHLMERNCQCTECGFRFFSKKALKAHMIKHTGERVHACGVCHKAYARKYTLREHMRIHDNDRRFRCTVCGMAFVQKCSLKSHLLSNHGISMAASDITSS